MLKSIRLQNFFGFQDCTINLEKGANVLVGINGSGKSNFFKAIRLLTELPKDKELKEVLYKEFGGLPNVIFADNKQDILRTTSLHVDCYLLSNLASETFYSIDLASNFNGTHIIERENFSTYGPHIKKNLEEINREFNVINTQRLNGGISENMGNSQISENTSFLYGGWEHQLRGNLNNYNLFRQYLDYVKIYSGFDTSRNSSLRTPNAPSLEKALNFDGSNLASLINDIKLSDKETYSRIATALKSVNNKFIGVEFKQLSGFIEMWLEEDGLNRAIPPIHISDGTLRFLALMTILYNPRRGIVVCIDEPELGLHPDMINTLHEAIEFASETSQIIISTHSAHLLDYFELEQIRIFEKDENNATIVNQVTKDDFEGWYETFNPGQMWRAGDFGGNRY